MPASRTNIWDLVRGPGVTLGVSPGNYRRNTNPPTLKASPVSPPDCCETLVLTEGRAITYYPRTEAERSTFRTKTGKKVTPHQWAVYDFTLSIPEGRVSTYKLVCDSMGEGSPRSVGSALRNNPFAPFVPCHRVIASNLFLGGFCGEWGPKAKTGTQFNRKLHILRGEGVEFDERGMLKSEERLWRTA